MRKLLKQITTCLILSAVYFSSSSQEIAQTVKGRIFDKESKVSLPGTNIVITSVTPVLGTTTDEEGYFAIPNVPVGRHNIQVSFIGYEPMILSEVMVGSGKEVVLNLELTESIIKLDDIVVKGENAKGEAINSMSMVSARSFNVEETRRYAGGMDDPVRLAAVYAGVSSASSPESNAIMIRGNSPVGVAWRVEGMEVPNPSHFSNADVMGGGAITMFSNHILSNSDFYTGAFPAEIGNAYSGAFDVRFRDGNSDKYEHAFQVGALGIDFASEGPLSKKSKASYLFNYRYSTLGLVSQFLPEGGLPVYQDLSFKLKFPVGKRSELSFWGLGGLDEFRKKAEDDSTAWDWEDLRMDIDSKFKSGSVGANFRTLFSNDAFLKASVAASGFYQSNNAKRINNDLNLDQFNKSTYFDSRLSAKVLYNNKHNARLTTRYGAIYSKLGYDYDVNIMTHDRTGMVKVSDTKGSTDLWQFFTQAKYSVTQNFIINAGLHSMYFGLNNKQSIEPRIGAKWLISPKHSLSLAYGMHAQQQLLSIYFIERYENDQTVYPNKDLDFTQAQHFVLGYDMKISENTRIKIEPYYQILSNLAVEEDGPLAMINVKDLHDFNSTFVSTGSGYNLGVDLTLERFLNNGFYYLATASIFDSKYKGGDGIERNTLYNNNYLVNLLAGKEWKLGAKKNKILGLNARVYLKGGERLTPADIVASESRQEIEYDYSRTFEDRAPATYRVDITATYQINKPKYALIFAAQINNALSSPTIYQSVYDYTQKRVRDMEDGAPFPNMSVKIEF